MSQLERVFDHSPAVDGTVTDSTRDRIARAVPESTRRVYAGDLARFRSWCDAVGRAAFPATAETLAEYVSHLCDEDRAPSTIERALAAIRTAHRAGGHDLPDTIGARMVLRSHRHDRAAAGKRTRKASPVTVPALRALVDSCAPTTVAGVRDRALVVLGFALGTRRSELVSLDLADVQLVDEGLLVVVRRSKTDPDAAGREVALPYGANPATCPVRAFRAWQGTLSEPATSTALCFAASTGTGASAPASPGKPWHSSSAASPAPPGFPTSISCPGTRCAEGSPRRPAEAAPISSPLPVTADGRTAHGPFSATSKRSTAGPRIPSSATACSSPRQLTGSPWQTQWHTDAPFRAYCTWTGVRQIPSLAHMARSEGEFSESQVADRDDVVSLMEALRRSVAAAKWTGAERGELSTVDREILEQLEEAVAAIKAKPEWTAADRVRVSRFVHWLRSYLVHRPPPIPIPADLPAPLEVVMLTRQQYAELVEELESLRETVEVLSEPGVLEEIERAEEQIRAGDYITGEELLARYPAG